MRGPTSRHLAAITVLVVVAAACSGDDDAETPPDVETVAVESTPPATEPVASTTTSEPSAPTTAEATAATTTAPATTAAPVSSTAPTTSTTLPPTTTSEPVAVAELVLRPDSIGSAYFGAEPQGVIDYVTSILGGTTDDSGWVAVGTIGSCGDTVNRRVHWGSLALVFADLSPYANGRRHFIGWEYGLDGELGAEPVGLRTPSGVTLGSRVVDLLAEFPDAAINPGQDDIGSPPNFYVSDDFRGLLTGAEPDDLVTVMFGGYGCAE